MNCKFTVFPVGSLASYETETLNLAENVGDFMFTFTGFESVRKKWLNRLRCPTFLSIFKRNATLLYTNTNHTDQLPIIKFQITILR